MEIGRSNEALWLNIGDEELIQGLTARLLLDPENWASAVKGDDRRLYHPEIISGLGLSQEDAESMHPPERVQTLARQPLDKAWRRDRAYRNAQHFVDHLSLSELEARTLALIFHLNTNHLLLETGEALEKVPLRNHPFTFSKLLDVSPGVLGGIFTNQNPLFRFGLVEVRSSFSNRTKIHEGYSVESPVANILGNQAPTREDALAPFFRPAPGPSLERNDYQHLHDDIGVILALIQQAHSESRSGVNILLHGPPGTGKTELAQLLGADLDSNTAFVPEIDEEGDSLAPRRRFQHLAACDYILSNNENSLVIMDECEDMICNVGLSFFLFNTSDKIPKAALNQTLETNRTPTIWVSNTTRSVDPAYLRRFSYVLPVDLPGPRQREHTLRRTLAEQPLSGDLLSRMAENESVSPALAATAARAAQASNAGEAEFEKAFTRALNNHLIAADAQPVPKPRTGVSLTWRRDCLNTDIGIAEFLDELDPNVGARFLLYGPPGTGKTAWGRQLAGEIERPLVVKRSSELVNPYVGVTEKNIAKAFHQAEEDNAVLLIDEADSFLDDRNQARQSWQISHVNQFLASMEEFDGFLVCTTNFDSRMDIASMRRFDFRVGFDYLTIGQAALLFGDLCGLAGIAAPDHDTLMEWLAGMTRLAPGDFHVLARRLRIRKHSTSAETLLEELQKECAYKEPEGRAIGFRADIH